MGYIGESAIEMEPIETDNIGSLGALVLAELPNCDDLLIRQQLAYALREFCRESNACVIEVPVCAECPKDTWGYRIPMPAAPQDMMVGTILDVKVAGGHASFKVRDTPYPHIHILGTYICKGDKVSVRFSVYPKVGGEVCPTWFKDRYAEAIVAGAMHHLLSMQKRPWSDPVRATQYGAKYADAISEASYRSTGSAAQGGPENAIPCGGMFM